MTLVPDTLLRRIQSTLQTVTDNYRFQVIRGSVVTGVVALVVTNSRDKGNTTTRASMDPASDQNS